MSERQPAFFFGHGNPMNAITHNTYTKAWRHIGEKLLKPQAILCISAHWYVPGTFVTAMQNPRTIHDFGGFPPDLFKFQYPAPGSPALAERIQSLLDLDSSCLDMTWGLDHGTWSVLCHIFPKADVPIVQLSIDERQPSAFHFELGKKLSALRNEGILIVGSGNVVHNLHAYAWGRHVPNPYDWATRFETKLRDLMTAGHMDDIVDYESLGPDAMLAAPTPDHFLPLLYILGLKHPSEKLSYPVEGVDGGSVSMLSVKIDQD